MKPGEYAAFIGFGGGLTWASMVIKWTGSKTTDTRTGISINQQRRQISYMVVRWRAQWKRLNQQITNFIERVTFRRNRIRRLRDKVDQL